MLFESSENKTSQNPRSLRYLVGASLCALINNVVLIGVDAVRGPLIAGVLLSWFLGGVTGFVWHSRITYNVTISIAAFLGFMSGALLGIPLAWSVLWMLTQLLGWPMWLASTAATLILFCYHYLNAFLALRWQAVVTLIRAWCA